ncbi:MAG: hypothetical protein ABIJ09_14205 [Pseudomonadota bacterium]
MAQRIRIGSKLTLLTSIGTLVLLAAASIGCLIQAAVGSTAETGDRLMILVVGLSCGAGLGYFAWTSELVEYVDLSDWVTVKTLTGTRSLPWDEIMALQLVTTQGRNGKNLDSLRVRPAHGKQVSLSISPYQKTEIIQFMSRTGRSDKLM